MDRVRRRIPGVVTALCVYVVIRATALAVLAVWADRSGTDLLTILGRRYDSAWLVGIATHGYDAGAPPGSASNLAFFPLYPLLIRLVALLPAVDPVGAGLFVGWVASLAAAAGLYLVGKQVRDRGTGLALVALWAALPHAVVQQMLYTESLFTALAAFCLLALLRGRWLVAGALCAVAGLARANAPALIAAVGVAAGMALWQRFRTRGTDPAAGPWWRPVAGAALAPVGWLAYQGWVGRRLGRWDGWLQVQSVWGSRFDGGGWTLGTAARLLTDRSVALAISMVVLVLFLAVLSLAMLRAPAPVAVYALVSLLLVVGTAGFFHSKARLLIPAFPLLLPLAAMLADAGPRSRWTALAGAGLVSAWFGAYLSLIWTQSP
ncbi:membrane protein [Pilimelia anulata]|uniref:Membrane protein n=1 Tax=Pilimelia anulata TaxID=53371 RepID=A0A8J3B6A0_9ACTN|nr:hypothetical protein [Pilimelia anulata]GGJ91248.1 membrane protein [Pilimelia anulata]